MVASLATTLVLSVWPSVDARSTTTTLGVAEAHKIAVSLETRHRWNVTHLHVAISRVRR